jgi:hypothetical protein
LINALYSGQRGLSITVRFADASKVKRGLVEINGNPIPFETQNYIFQETIDPGSVLEGPNAVKITPNSDAIDVTELRIDVI